MRRISSLASSDMSRFVWSMSMLEPGLYRGSPKISSRRAWNDSRVAAPDVVTMTSNGPSTNSIVHSTAPWSLRRQRCDAVCQDNKAVALQGDEGFAVCRLLAGGDGPEGVGAPLSERALEPGLLAERLVAPAARRAAVGKRTLSATRD